MVENYEGDVESVEQIVLPGGEVACIPEGIAWDKRVPIYRDQSAVDRGLMPTRWATRCDILDSCRGGRCENGFWPR